MAVSSHLLYVIGGTISRFLFYPVIYLRNLPPGKERAALCPYGLSSIFGLAGPGAVTVIYRYMAS